jgi:hypothetical protein
MENAIIIINDQDIASAVQVSQDMDSYKVYIFDPVLVDKVIASGLQNVEFTPWENCPLYHELDITAHDLALKLEKELDREVRSIIPEVSIVSWQHLNLYYLFMTIKWYSKLWEEVSGEFTNCRVHIFFCSNPARYFFNSFIHSFLLSWSLNAHGIEFTAHTYGEETDNSNLIPNLFGLSESENSDAILLHIPTCLYDFEYFNQEIIASGKSVINLKSKWWNVPINSKISLGLIDVDLLTPSLSVATQEKINYFTNRLEASLDIFFQSYIPMSDFRNLQVTYIRNLYRSQLTTYFLLNQYFEQTMPSKILLSDHDTGFHGPIVSFAKKNFLPILILPHSKVSSKIEFNYGNMIALTHPSQELDVFNINDDQVVSKFITYPEVFYGSSIACRTLNSISLVLNAQSINGIYMTSHSVYMVGIKKIVEWCKGSGVELKIRCKPGYSMLNILAKSAGVNPDMLVQCANETMEQFARSSDLCLVYDSPTTGSLFFYRNSVPLLNVVIEPLTSAERKSANSTLSPIEDVDGALCMLNQFLSDSSYFNLFRSEQFCKYIQLFQSSEPLRFYL